jgi:hypothetical protein
MAQINALIGSILQAPQVERQKASEALDSARQQKALQKNVAARDGDTFEHQIENASEVHEIDDQRRQREAREKKQEDEEAEEVEEKDNEGGDSLDITG